MCKSVAQLKHVVVEAVVAFVVEVVSVVLFVAVGLVESDPFGFSN